jgi:DNA-nicking Smr family endonuclease
MARRRTLRPDEEELWRSVARTARPLHAHPMFSPQSEPAAEVTAFHPLPDPAPKARIAPFQVGSATQNKGRVDLLPTLASTLLAAPLQMDAKVHGKMRRGKLVPEARIDLHGMTLSEAHPELIGFILNAQSAGLRLVLVITGKGKRGQDIGPIPQRVGALRHQVPQWLRLPPLGPAVLQITEAHLKHGGSGAYYVYLRRR